MCELAVNRREFHAFLSHAYADKKIVDQINYFLNRVAKIPVWYDAFHLPPAAHINTELPRVIGNCRNMIIILSNKSISSGYVEFETNHALNHQIQCKNFRIIPVRIDGCKVPEHLSINKWIDLKNGEIDLESLVNLFLSLSYKDVYSHSLDTRDVYVSRTWRENEARLADNICKMLDEHGFRLIGDYEDQSGFDEHDRVKSIISSCGGLVAILPHRGNGKTSRYMLKEIKIAKDINLPVMIVADAKVNLPDDIAKSAIKISNNQIDHDKNLILQEEIKNLENEWKKPVKPHYIFYSTDFKEKNTEKNFMIKRLIESVTAMPCVMGEEIDEGNLQEIITKKIRESFFMMADISGYCDKGKNKEKKVNTLIEAGIARGAGKKLFLLSETPRRTPPFMFRDQQIFYYDNDKELIGKIYRLIYPYRRRILNYELQKQSN